MKRLFCIFIFFVVSCTTPQIVNSSDETTYNDALSMYDKGNYDSAIILFNNIYTNMDYSLKLDNSQYYLGKSYYKKASIYFINNNFDSAVILLKQSNKYFKLINQQSYYYSYANYYLCNTYSLLSILTPKLYGDSVSIYIKNFQTNYDNNNEYFYKLELLKNYLVLPISTQRTIHNSLINYELKNYSNSQDSLLLLSTKIDFSTYPDLSYYLAMSLFHNNQYSLASQYFLKAIDDYKYSDYILKAKFRYGINLYYNNQLTEAKTIFDSLNNTTSFQDQIIYYIAMIDFKNSFYSNAKDGFLTIINNYPNSIKLDDSYFYLGKLYYTIKDYNNAKKYFTQYKILFPNGINYTNANNYLELIEASI